MVDVSSVMAVVKTRRVLRFGDLNVLRVWVVLDDRYEGGQPVVQFVKKM